MEKIILDTDISTDCDDAGAISVLHNLANENKAEILSITHCGSDLYASLTIFALNSYYKRENISVGNYKVKPFLEGEFYRHFTKGIGEKYLETNKMPEIPDAVKIMRKKLYENNDVTIVTIGMLNNIYELLKSEADEICNLNGYELVKSKVKRLYVMGGNFEDLNYLEYNIKTDVTAASFVAENFPAQIIYCGFEVGERIVTGKRIINATDDNPVKYAYGKYNFKGDSWDLATVYCAVLQNNEFFQIVDNKTITFDSEGKTVIKDGGKDGYIKTVKPLDVVGNEIDKYFI